MQINLPPLKFVNIHFIKLTYLSSKITNQRIHLYLIVALTRQPNHLKASRNNLFNNYLLKIKYQNLSIEIINTKTKTSEMISPLKITQNNYQFYLNVTIKNKILYI